MGSLNINILSKDKIADIEECSWKNNFLFE